MEKRPYSDFRIDLAELVGNRLPYIERIFCLCVCHDTGERRKSRLVEVDLTQSNRSLVPLLSFADLQAVDQFVSCFHSHLRVVLNDALYK